ncbi:hypothetical protein WG954_19585 [Lacibacter sp. H375]|uniref:hypothetical protein n=1 Tax=Lacibacter sp. H375 TaxID=3133424 RepID=UPI0030C0E491
MKVFVCIFTLLLLANVQYAQDTSNRRQSTNRPKDTTKKAGSSFLESLAKNIQDEKKRKDSLNNYYRQHPMETNAYVSKYLVDRRVLPNDDAIRFIKALNPNIRNLEEINYYAELKMPAFKRLKKTDRKRLKKESKRSDKYNSIASKTFLIKLNELDAASSQFTNGRVRSDARNRLVNTISEIQSELASIRSKRMPMGITVFLTNQVAILNQVLADVNRSGSISQLQQRIVQAVRDNMNYHSLKMSSVYPIGKQSKQRSLMVADSGPTETVENEELFYSTAHYITGFIGEADIKSKICAIYAKTVTTNGNIAKEVDIDVRYFFSYETAVQAQYKCKTGKCDGFTEQNGLVSANGANIIPSNYVFRFRDRESNRIYFRCISKELFEQVQSNPGTGNSRKFRIIFFPDNEECTAFMPR